MCPRQAVQQPAFAPVLEERPPIVVAESVIDHAFSDWPLTLAEGYRAQLYIAFLCSLFDELRERGRRILFATQLEPDH